MHIIELRGDDWKSIVDFDNALGRALNAYDRRVVGNVHSVDALLELLIWDVSSAGSPPYTIRVSGISKQSEEIRTGVALIQRLLLGAREESRVRRGYDVEVYFEIER